MAVVLINIDLPIVSQKIITTSKTATCHFCASGSDFLISCNIK